MFVQDYFSILDGMMSKDDILRQLNFSEKITKSYVLSPLEMVVPHKRYRVSHKMGISSSNELKNFNKLRSQKWILFLSTLFCKKRL